MVSNAFRVPAPTRFYDLIYHPAETVFLRHGRSTGHPTMNGKAMIVNQAMIAFCERKASGRGVRCPIEDDSRCDDHRRRPIR